MAASAAIKLTQGITTAAAGVSLIGVLTTTVVASNGNDSDIVFWQWEVVDVPPASVVTTGIRTQGSVATLSFSPDAVGGYLLHLITRDKYGNQAEDFRVFQVLEVSGRLIPPFEADAGSLNFASQKRGWAKYLEVWLKYIDTLSSGPTYTYPSKTTTYTLVASDFVVFADPTGGGFTLTLPASPVLGESHTVKNKTASTNTITVGGGGHNIDGSATYLMSNPRESVTVVYNGAEWSAI